METAMSTGNVRHWRQRALLCMIGLVSLFSMGCEFDSYMDPSETYRGEATPVTMPILDRLDVIEEPEEAIPGLTGIRPEDLIPEVTEYVMGPGDLVTFTVFELIQPNVETVQTRRVDELGFVRLPVIGQLQVAGLSTKEAEQAIIDILDPDILRNPQVTVIVQEGRQKTFNVIGAARAVGTYTLLKSNFRLMDALALARGIPETTEKIYIIRQIPLSEIIEYGVIQDRPEPGEVTPPLRPSDAEPETSPQPGDPTQTIQQLLEENAQQQMPEQDMEEEPADVPEEMGQMLEPEGASDGQWVYINDQWVQVNTPAGNQAGQLAQSDNALSGASLDELVTQRIIEVDAQELVKGVAKWNIVVRPGDIIRIPSAPTGNVFIGGNISRPGTYGLPADSQLTLLDAIISAGGLSPVGIPERIDLTRRVGPNQEATVRLNLRAIVNGQQPNLFLKPNDRINVGTNLLASFAAVIRNSFRMTYGFGFLLDRNFSSEVFGQ